MNGSLRIFSSVELLFCLLLFIMQVSAQGNDEKNTTIGLNNIKANMFVSFAYVYNLNNPISNRNQFRVFDFDNNTFKVDAVELALHRDAAQPTEAGFRIDVVAGSSIPKISASPGLLGGDLDIHQVYGSYIFPCGNGLRLDIGKFITHTGYEVIEGFDGYNDNVSRSFLFGYAIPFTHTGVHFSYPFSDHVSAVVLVVNGWDNAVDNNKSKTIGAQLFYTPNEKMNVWFNVVAGPERAGNNSDNRFLYDVVGTVKISEAFTLGLNVDYGLEQYGIHDTVTNTFTDAQWSGFAGYLKYSIKSNFTLAMRGEFFNDADGFRTGITQKLNEFTLTPEWKCNENVIFRGDMRLDVSDSKVFDNETGFIDSQFTITLNGIFIF